MVRVVKISVKKTYLNTSYVKVQYKSNYTLLDLINNLNTSYVKVQFLHYLFSYCTSLYLNTSYVKVQFIFSIIYIAI